MGKFLEIEKKRQVACKKQRHLFSKMANEEGEYKKQKRSFCLPLEIASENLYEGIRTQAMQYFADGKIQWHDGKNGMPSNHLCSSQVCCVNFLFSFTNNPELLKVLLQPIFPDIKKMRPVEADRFVEFEWIGNKDYLGEAAAKNRKGRSRGAAFTSADAMVMFEKTDGHKQTVLIEWKYTESYARTSIATSKSGTKRTETYQQSFDEADCKIDKTMVKYEALFYEPFYQLLRQQLLAQKMEAAHEAGADIVSVLHIAPDCNHDFKKVTSAKLEHIGSTSTEIWGRVVKDKRFISVSTEYMFGNLPGSITKGMSAWATYIKDRYSSIT